ncbi:hypothetical protein GCM10010862_39470 [Devosia nitrariae]|uniref:NB-ARC domain-containing protein n=1 Tax=Devosia nitrariae TaxID=2071872 RepID=A0ABQ5W9Y7_9HYPH|nr:hypothetical protein GCM10010862_39470 [Devosia nitrariae]
MNPQTRNLLVKRIAEAVEAMGPAPVFERFAVVLVEHLLNIELFQSGSSISGNPVAGTLDATSADQRVVVEASALQTYFGQQMAKARNDLLHALELAPGAERILLVSSQRAPVGTIEDFVQDAARDPATADREIAVLDSRRIAEAIVDELVVKDNAMDALSELLPALDEVRDLHPYNLAAPVLDSRFVPREEVDRELSLRLADSTCVEVAGLGGLGKSMAAAAFLRRHGSEFEYPFWVDARTIRGVEQLSAIPLRRGGADRNVLGLLKRHRCLVVLDDASEELTSEALLEVCGPESRIVVTRRRRMPGSYDLPLMSGEEARQLLDAGLASPVPDPAFEAIIAAIGGHPLSLRLVNAAVRSGASWDEMIEDCPRLGSMADGEVLLAERVLGRLRPILSGELSVFVWAGQPNCDREFLKSVVGTLGIRKLQEFGLTAPDSPSSVRLHDIVYSSLRTGDWLSPQQSRELDDALERYLATQMRGDGHGLQTTAAQLRNRVRELAAAGDRRPAFLHALLAAWSPHEIDPALLPVPAATAAEIADRGATGSDAEILLVLETIEALNRYEKHVNGYASAQAMLRDVLPVYAVLGGTPGLSPRQTAEIKHHHAKTLRLLRREDEALALFEEVVASFPLNEAKLQLVRLHASRGRYERATTLALEIIEAHRSGEGVSASVLMGLSDTLNGGRARWSGEILAAHDKHLMSQALFSAASGVAQGYDALSAFARSWAWNAPERLQQLLSQLPEPTPFMLSDERSRAGYAEILYHAALMETCGSSARRALEAYESLRSTDAFQRRRWGEVLNMLGRFEDAESVLQDIDDPDGRIWVANSLSQTKLGLGKTGEALALADEAIAGATGRNEIYRASFLLQRAKTLLAIGQDPTAEVEAALAGGINPRQRAELLDMQASLRRDHLSTGR